MQLFAANRAPTFPYIVLAITSTFFYNGAQGERDGKLQDPQRTFLSRYLTNLMHKICFIISFIVVGFIGCCLKCFVPATLTWIEPSIDAHKV
jgi:hypothetical protein